MKIKKIVFCLTAAAMLTACGSGEKPSGDGGSGQKVVINVWAMGEEAKKMDQMVQPFEEATGYDVQIQSIPWLEAHDKLLTALASKSGPDVIQMGTSWMPEFVEAEALAELTEYIAKDDGLKADKFFEGSVATTQFEGKTYGIPLHADTRLLYYRSDLLESIGFSSAPTTWAELKEASEKLSARGDGFYGIGWDPKEQSLMPMLANQAGGGYYGSEPNLNFDTPEYIEAVEYVNSFYRDGEVPVDIGLESVQGLKDDGIAPMFVSGAWMINSINENAPELEGKWATAVLPKGKSSNMSILGGSNLTIFNYSKIKDESAEFISYMASEEAQIIWHETTSSLPANVAVWENNASLKEDKYLAPFGEQLKNAQPMPLVPEFEEIAQKWLLDFEKIYRAGEDVETTVKSFNESVQKIIK